MKVASLVTNVFLHAETAKLLQTKRRKKASTLDKSIIALVRDVELPQPMVGPTKGETVHLQEKRKHISKSTSRSKLYENYRRFHHHSGKIGTTSGSYHGGAPHHCRPNAPKFADRDPNCTLRAEADARKAAWQWAKQLYRVRGTYLENEETFFSLKMEWRVASVSTVNPDEIIFWILDPLWTR